MLINTYMLCLDKNIFTINLFDLTRQNCTYIILLLTYLFLINCSPRLKKAWLLSILSSPVTLSDQV